jgi:hypothetical protein
MKIFQFKGVRVYTEFITVELECETLEEAQGIIDSGLYEDNIVSSSGFEDVELEYVGIENYMDLDDPRLLDTMFGKK